MRRIVTYWENQRSIVALVTAVLLLAVIMLQAHIVSAATLTSASMTLSDPRPSTASNYTFQASNVTTSSIRCISIEFDTAHDGTGGKPTNLTTTGATFSGNYVPTPASWTVNNNNTTGITNITLAGGETPASASGRTVTLTGLTNGSVADDDYFAIFKTFNNTDCSTTPVDSVVVNFIFTNGQAVSMSVESTLAFTVAGVAGTGSNTVNSANITNGLTTTSATIPFGTISSSANKVAAQDLTVSTNAGAGYTVYTRYTGVPTSGAYTISDLGTAPNSAPVAFTAAGTEGFGYTTEDATLSGTANRFTTSGGNKWAAFTTSNAELVYSAAAVNNQTTRVGFQAGVANTTEPGSYVTSVIYTAVPIY